MANSTERSVRVRFSGDTSGLASAARRGERVIDRFGDDSARGFIGGWRRRWRRDGANMFARAAGDGLAAFGTAMQGGIVRNPVIAGGIGAAVLAGVLVAMPMIGALAAGLLVGAFGAGLAGIGIAVAAQNAEVQSAFVDLKDNVLDTLKDIAEPFEDTLINIAGYAQETFDSFAPALEDAFADLAPAVDEFAQHLFEAFEAFIPVIEPVSDAFIAMMEALGPELPGMFTQIATAIADIADKIAANPDTFVSVVQFFISATTFALGFIEVLNDIAGWFQEHPAVIEGIVIGLGAVIAAFSLRVFAAGLRIAAAWLLALGPIGIIIAAVAALVTAVIIYWDEIKAAISAAVDAVGAYLQATWASIQRRARIAWALIRTFIIDPIRSAYNWLKDRIRDIGEFFGNLPGWISDGLYGVYDAITGPFRDAFGWIEDQISSIRGSISSLDDGLSGLPGPLGGIGGFLASGGTAVGGRSYIVGEKGPELFTPGTTGTVTPNHELGGGGDTHVHVEISRRAIEGIAEVTVERAGKKTKRRVLAGTAVA